MYNSSVRGCPLCGPETEYHSVARTELALKLLFTAVEAGDGTVIHEK